MKCRLCGSVEVTKTFETPAGTLAACAEHENEVAGFWLKPRMRITKKSFNKARGYEGSGKDDRPSGGGGGRAFGKAAGE